MTDTLAVSLLDHLKDATIEHRLLGRVRIRIKDKRGDEEYFKKLVAALSEFDAIEEIRANPRTGGVLILHTLSEQQIDRLVPAAGCRSGAGSHREDESQGRSQRPRVSPPSPKELAGGAMQLLSLIQLVRGRIAGSAGEQSWYSYQLRRLDMPGLAPLFAVLALLQLARGRMLPPASSLFMYSLFLKRNRRR